MERAVVRVVLERHFEVWKDVSVSCFVRPCRCVLLDDLLLYANVVYPPFLPSPPSFTCLAGSHFIFVTDVGCTKPEFVMPERVVLLVVLASLQTMFDACLLAFLVVTMVVSNGVCVYKYFPRCNL